MPAKQARKRMILTTLQDSGRIEMLHPLFKKAFDFVRSHSLTDAPLGRIEVEGDSIFINNCQPECVSAEAQVLEVHRQYIDIHILLEGEETVGWKPLADCHNEAKTYSEAEDCALYAEPAMSYVTMRPGQVLIVWPEDAHAPVIGNGTIRKLIVKVKI